MLIVNCVPEFTTICRFKWYNFIMLYDKKDVPNFQEEYCKTECILKGKCINEKKEDHWFLMCPHYHKWKLGYDYVIK